MISPRQLIHKYLIYILGFKQRTIIYCHCWRHSDISGWYALPKYE